jgi:hypothetical protein
LATKKGQVIKRKSERHTKTERQCTWVGEETGERCKEKAIGHFFCAYHFKMASEIEENTAVYSVADTIKEVIGDELKISDKMTTDFKSKFYNI